MSSNCQLSITSLKMYCFQIRKLFWTTIYLVTVCYHVTYAFQSESTLYICLNVKELLARNRRKWLQRDSNPQPAPFFYELSGCGFESRCSHLNLFSALSLNKTRHSKREKAPQNELNQWIVFFWVSKAIHLAIKDIQFSLTIFLKNKLSSLDKSLLNLCHYFF